MVYVNQRALVQQLDTLLPLYKKWGFKVIKFGCVQIGNQRWSTWLHDAVRKCGAVSYTHLDVYKRQPEFITGMFLLT